MLEYFDLVKFNDVDEDQVKNCFKMQQEKFGKPLDDVTLSKLARQSNYKKSGCKKVWRLLQMSQNSTGKHIEL